MHACVSSSRIVMTTTASKQILVSVVLHQQLGAMQKELDNFTKEFVVKTQE